MLNGSLCSSRNSEHAKTHITCIMNTLIEHSSNNFQYQYGA